MAARTTYAGQPRRSGVPLSMMALGVLLIGVVGGALLLHAAGVVRLPFLSAQEKPSLVSATCSAVIALKKTCMLSATGTFRASRMPPASVKILTGAMAALMCGRSGQKYWKSVIAP